MWKENRNGYLKLHIKSKKVRSGIMNHAKNLWEISESFNYMGGSETFARWFKMKLCEMHAVLVNLKRLKQCIQSKSSTPTTLSLRFKNSAVKRRKKKKNSAVSKRFTDLYYSPE